MSGQRTVRAEARGHLRPVLETVPEMVQGPPETSAQASGPRPGVAPDPSGGAPRQSAAARRGTAEPLLYPLEGGGQAPDRPHVALVPGAEVPLLALDLPPGLRGQTREDVARRQLQDLLGLSGEPGRETGRETGGIEIRPFPASSPPGLWIRALVAGTDRVARWRDRAAPAATALIPDYLALPAAEGVWTLAGGVGAGGAGGTVLARLGPGDGFAAEPELARMLLLRALGTVPDGAPDRPRALLLEPGAPDWAAALFEAEGIAVLTAPAEAEALGLAPPRRFAHGETAVDLRADPRAERARLARRVLPWRWPLLAGLLAAGIWSAAQIVAVRALDEAARAERQAATALVRAEFVPSGPLLDLPVQVGRALDGMRGEAEAWRARVSPLTLLSRAAPVIAGAGEAPEAELGEVRYGPSEGLVLGLRLADFSALDRLVQALGAAGLVVELRESRVAEGGAGVEAELGLSSGPGPTTGPITRPVTP